MDKECAMLRCTTCGDTYEMPGITYDDLRAEGVHPRKVHGKLGIPGKCPKHSPEAKTS